MNGAPDDDRGKTDMRVLYLDIDSMRPDHFGCYGYRRNTTPNLDAVAQQGVRFRHAYCNSSRACPRVLTSSVDALASTMVLSPTGGQDLNFDFRGRAIITGKICPC
jgi:hypothetical protein